MIESRGMAGTKDKFRNSFNGHWKRSRIDLAADWRSDPQEEGGQEQEHKTNRNGEGRV